MDKKIVLTLTVYPPAQGGRPVIVTAAPEGELPAVYRGLFADLHRLLDQAWVDVNTRQVEPVVVAQPKPGQVEADAPETTHE